MSSQVDDLFGEPPLIKGEDKERYFRLLAAIEHDVEPKTTLEKIMAREMTDKLWEEQRYKRNAACLVETAYFEALTGLIAPFCGLTEFPVDIAKRYYTGDSATKKATAARLAGWGITDDQIRAKAMQLCGGGLQLFERMGMNRENSRRILRKEIEGRADHESGDKSPAST
jgi:hypothetical protein